MEPPARDPLSLGQRLVTLLETGRRVSTYKLATLTALVDHCVEQAVPDPGASLRVPIQDLAERVVALYWRQTQPYEAHGMLRQNEQEGRGIPERVHTLRLKSEVAGARTVAECRERLPDDHRRVVDAVALTLAQQPLTALQTPGRVQRSMREPFLFDDNWLHKKITRSELDHRDWSIELFPGVAWDLARLAGLLRPVVELLRDRRVRADRGRGRLLASSPHTLAHLSAS
jgi:hypothetical protein